MNLKWIWVIVLAVVGILALVVGILFITQPIHTLPTFLGGKHELVKGKHVRGHYQRRGEGLIAVAVVAFGVAAYLGYRFRRQDRPAAAAVGGGTTTAAPADGGSAGSLLGGTDPTPGATTEP